jgi:hypothetical protein
MLLRKEKNNERKTFFLPRLTGSNLVGRDITGDGLPDIPLTYTIQVTTPETEFTKLNPGSRLYFSY